MAKNILAVAAHPDDLELSCFGTLLKYKQAGDVIDVVILTSGGYIKKYYEGESRDRNWEMISKEIAASEEILGVDFTILDNPVLDLKFCKDTVNQMDKIIKRKEYDIVITHSKDETHQDHVRAYQIVNAACRSGVKELWLMENCIYTNRQDSFVPNIFVDITDTIEKKIMAVECYSSYVNSKIVSAVSNLAKARALHFKNAEYVESFQQVFRLEG